MLISKNYFLSTLLLCYSSLALVAASNSIEANNHPPDSLPRIAIIFDCDGVLVDSEPNHFIAWHETLKNHKIHLTLDDYFPFVGHSGKNIIKMLASQRQIILDEHIALKKQLRYKELQQQNITPLQSAITFVHQLRANQEKLNCVIGLASSAPRAEIMHNLHAIGLADVFDVIVSGRDDLGEFNDPEGTNKPKPYIYQKTAKLLGVSPAQCIVFEDSNAGITAAHTAGMTVIAVPNEFTKGHDFSRASHVLSSFDMITPNDVIIFLPKAN